MASKHANIWKALKTHLEAYPGAPTGIVYGGENYYDANPLVPYWIVDFVIFEPLRRYYSSNDPNWNTGSLIVNCMIPLDWDDLQSIEYAGAVADYFSQDTQMTFDGTTVCVSKQSQIDGGGMRDGDHLRIPVTVMWEGYA